MNCIIGNTNVKILGKAIYSLGKIGDDLFLEILENGLIFRTVNSARSAYVCFSFQLPFFLQYQNLAVTKCKISLKSCLIAFRSLPVLEKTIERCIIRTDTSDDTLLIQFCCRHDVTKVFHLPLIDNESVQAAFPNQEFRCKLRAPSGLFTDGIQNFSTAVDEVTFHINEERMTVKNYIDDEPDPKKVIHTELKLESSEFEVYDVTENTEVTFCLKELKAVLSFTEGCNMPITVSLQRSGKPVMFSISSVPGVESDFILATLAEQGSTAVRSTSRNNPVISASVVKGNRQRYDASNTSQQQKCTPKRLATRHSQQEVQQNQDSIYNENYELMDQNPISSDDNAVPLTPPKKKFRSLFLGLSQASNCTLLPDPDEVLAEASDYEDNTC